MDDVPLTQHAAEFKLSITRALADQLAQSLNSLRPTPLTVEALDALAKRAGVYELWLKGERVYVGKASKDLPTRLGKHLRKLSGRSGVSREDVGFMCLYVDEDLEAAAPEKMLIKKYSEHDAIPWNTNGFGNNDPGRRRDNSLVKANHFDASYPINLDLRVSAGKAGSRSVKKFLSATKKNLPFTFRFETKTENEKDLTRNSLDVPDRDLSAREIVRLALSPLPSGWQATALPGYLILYKEEHTYDSAIRIWRKTDTGDVEEYAGPGLLDEPEEIEEEEDSDEDASA